MTQAHRHDAERDAADRRSVGRSARDAEAGAPTSEHRGTAHGQPATADAPEREHPTAVPPAGGGRR